MANLFRLNFHVQAHYLLVRIRREIAAPPQPLPDDDGLPVEALEGRARKHFTNLRRRAGLLHPCPTLGQLAVPVGLRRPTPRSVNLREKTGAAGIAV